MSEEKKSEKCQKKMSEEKSLKNVGRKKVEKKV